MDETYNQDIYEIKTQMKHFIDMLNNRNDMDKQMHEAILTELSHLSELVEAKMAAQKDNHDLQLKQLNSRVSSLEDIVRKITWTVISVVVLAVLGLVIVTPKM